MFFQMIVMMVQQTYTYFNIWFVILQAYENTRYKPEEIH